MKFIKKKSRLSRPFLEYLTSSRRYKKVNNVYWTLDVFIQRQDGAKFCSFLILELHVSSYDMYKLFFQM